MNACKVTILLLAAASTAAAQRRVIFPPGAKPVGPYSPGIFAGDFLYVSGQGARDSSNAFPATPDAQVRQTLENIRTIVEAAGLKMEHIVYAQVYLHSSVGYDTMNTVWRKYFPKDPPARATLGVYRMPTETPVEITVVALRDLTRRKPVNPKGWPADSPISAGMIAGPRLYVSGLLGRDAATGRVPGDPAEQVRLALERVKGVLAEAKLDFRHMVFVNPYLTSAMPMNVMNTEYARHFEHGNTPARATIRVHALPMGANIEFTGVAVTDLSMRRAIRPKNMAPSATASPCVWAGDTFYCSAKAGFIPGANGGIFADNVEDQVRQTMRNLLDGLEEADLAFSNVVASNVYVDNLDEFAKMNAVYGRYFPKESPPTRTTVAPIAPVERRRSESGHFPKLEEVSIIAVR